MTLNQLFDNIQYQFDLELMYQVQEYELNHQDWYFFLLTKESEAI